MLPDSSIKTIRLRLPHLRIIVLLRDPVERLWSQPCMEWRKGKGNRAIERLGIAPTDIASENSSVGCIRQKLNKWALTFDREQLHCRFLEDISDNPHATAASIFDFRGASTSPSVGLPYARATQPRQLA
jgi:hypothetical protein